MLFKREWYVHGGGGAALCVFIIWASVVTAQVRSPRMGVPPALTKITPARSKTFPQPKQKPAPSKIDSDTLRIRHAWASFQEPYEFLYAINDFSVKRYAKAPRNAKASPVDPKILRPREVESRFRRCGFKQWKLKDLPIPTATKTEPAFLGLASKLDKLFLFRGTNAAYGIVNINKKEVMCQTLVPFEVEAQSNSFSISAIPPEVDICEMAQKVVCPHVKIIKKLTPSRTIIPEAKIP